MGVALNMCVKYIYRVNGGGKVGHADGLTD